MMDQDAELRRRIAALSAADRQALMARLGLTEGHTDSEAAQERLELSIAKKKSPSAPRAAAEHRAS
ncbi:hypothetical protein [Frigidibacter sp. ROC022]|uniref:hypothetical protein n=1 Tax=Frigidibacter sp. ROC022 TaxID=2971796 RepID=UPI00215AFD88|nr:hypothetical protein [Frigidibacter sp. ROC022]MCR8726577.1 hypothetical protein [Frigidibacter sp. ROC022]